MPIVFEDREKFFGPKLLKLMLARSGDSVTVTKEMLRKMCRDFYEAGYEGGHFDHGQSTGDIRDIRRDEFVDEKEIAVRVTDIE